MVKVVSKSCLRHGPPGRAVLLLFLLAGIFLMTGGYARPAVAAESQPIKISSDRLEAQQGQRQVTFSGNVVAVQGDLTIKGDRLVIYYTEGAASSNPGGDLGARVERIVVEGNVRISQGDRVATGERAVYNRGKNTVVLTGSPRIKRNRDYIQGERITLYLDRDESVIEGGASGPVRATIYTEPGKTLGEAASEGG